MPDGCTQAMLDRHLDGGDYREPDEDEAYERGLWLDELEADEPAAAPLSDEVEF